MHTVEYNCIQVHGAYSCVYMHTDAYTCVQTCTPQDFSSHFPSSSFSSSSLGLACHLSQNTFPPATVCNYASRCMPPHTGMLTSLSSLLSSLLLLSASGVGGVLGPFRSVCITGIISTAASIQMHRNAYTCIHNTHAYPISVIACLLPFEDALRSWVGGGSEACPDPAGATLQSASALLQA